MPHFYKIGGGLPPGKKRMIELNESFDIAEGLCVGRMDGKYYLMAKSDIFFLLNGAPVDEISGPILLENSHMISTDQRTHYIFCDPEQEAEEQKAKEERIRNASENQYDLSVIKANAKKELIRYVNDQTPTTFEDFARHFTDFLHKFMRFDRSIFYTWEEGKLKPAYCILKEKFVPPKTIMRAVFRTKTYKYGNLPELSDPWNSIMEKHVHSWIAIPFIHVDLKSPICAIYGDRKNKNICKNMAATALFLCEYISKHFSTFFKIPDLETIEL